MGEGCSNYCSGFCSHPQASTKSHVIAILACCLLTLPISTPALPLNSCCRSASDSVAFPPFLPIDVPLHDRPGANLSPRPLLPAPKSSFWGLNPPASKPLSPIPILGGRNCVRENSRRQKMAQGARFRKDLVPSVAPKPLPLPLLSLNSPLVPSSWHCLPLPAYTSVSFLSPERRLGRPQLQPLALGPPLAAQEHPRLPSRREDRDPRC